MKRNREKERNTKVGGGLGIKGGQNKDFKRIESRGNKIRV